MHTGSQQLRGVAMSQIVKPDPGEVLDPRYQASELMRQALRLQRFAVGPSTHQGFASLPNAEHQKFFRLLALESPPPRVRHRLSNSTDRRGGQTQGEGRPAWPAVCLVGANFASGRGAGARKSEKGSRDSPPRRQRTQPATRRSSRYSIPTDSAKVCSACQTANRSHHRRAPPLPRVQA